MALTTAKNFLLVTEHIGQKPTLRTRFTTQAYFVLATLLDLLDQEILQVEGDRLIVADEARLDQQPAYLNSFRIRLTSDIAQDDRLKTVLKLVTSWDIVNAIYDGIGAETLAEQTTERVLFQNNLKPHVIYEPTATSKQEVLTTLEDQIQAGKLTRAGSNLFLILSQQDALKWLFDEAEGATLSEQFAAATAGDSYVQTVKQVTVAAAEIIQMKKFEMDGWLS
ncbi:hypothetical protein ACFQ44_02530 [Levilactobacillus lanxiensis]|uniref:GPP34 family phosphoprotein n=1 Tax=Levilactobacillus lanxiensis TaxID=2799568 RepID=A0ABW4D3I8_9LACO|nr:hypothetical protein [Levilactobacillus lanxiensis]